MKQVHEFPHNLIRTGLIVVTPAMGGKNQRRSSVGYEKERDWRDVLS